MAVGRPAEPIDHIAERLIAAREFLAFEEAAALAAGVLEPDVIVLEVILLGFELAVNRVGNAAVGSEGEGGDFFVDGLEGLVEILGAGGWQRTAAEDNAKQRAEFAEPPKAAARARAGHGLGCGPV
ncbi:MAG: hypothetical protein AUH86_12230 [Acidobacteria bacterium 13_1_40CM_4_58_4]|nr:MAG: hypothetical protein AUH86_12230 [Acidobacteria bacterium 13_1_40CM_4_58_4]